MSSTKLVKLEALKEQLQKLEADPELQKEIKKRQTISKSGKALGIATDDEIAEMLVPGLVGAKSSLQVKGLGSRPAQDERKIMLYLDLMHLEKRVKEQLAELVEDPVIKVRQALVESIAELKLSPVDAAILVAPVRMDTFLKKSDKKPKQTPSIPKTRRPLSYWYNPNTGELVVARSTGRIELKRWANEHGNHIYEDWKISEDQARKIQNDNK
jgi:hypothetical protein